MANCVTCKANCISAGQHQVHTDCISYVPKDYPKPIINADRIRAMTDEELAEFIAEVRNAITCVISDEDSCRNPDEPCQKCWLDWLRQEVKDG